MTGFYSSPFLFILVAMNKYFFRECGTVKNTIYLTSAAGNSNMMMLKFDNSFASDRTPGKGFSLTLETANAGTCKR